MGTTKATQWGKLGKESATAGLLKFSGTRTADRCVDEDEKVFLLVEAHGGDWTKFQRNGHGDLERVIPIVIDEVIECPGDLREPVGELLKQAADERAGRVPLPGMGGDPDTDDDDESNVVPIGDGIVPEP